MTLNEGSISLIIASIEWYTRVASQLGWCTVGKSELCEWLNAIRTLSEENEKLKADLNIN